MDQPASESDERHRRRWSTPVVVGAAVVLSLLSVQITAYATDKFSDVPAGNPFHDEIGWLADTGISTGFGDGTYRPTDPVTRQAMAAFLQRMFNLRDQVAVASDVAATSVTSTSYVDFAAAKVTLTVPPGTKATLLARFTGSSTCSGTATPGFCDVTITVNGSEMEPQHPAGFNYNFDSNDHGTEGPNSASGNTITRTSGPVGPGTYTLQVRAKISVSDTTFSLADWVLVGEAILEPSI